MKGRRYVEDEDEYEEPGDDFGGGDWQPDAGDDLDDDEADDSSDSDFGSKRKSTPRKAKKNVAAAKGRQAKTPAQHRPAAKRSRKRVSSDESEADDSESDEELDEAWAAAPVRTGSRPRRQAAQKATANIKHTYEEEDDDVAGAGAAHSNQETPYAATVLYSHRGSYRSPAPQSYPGVGDASYAAPVAGDGYSYAASNDYRKQAAGASNRTASAAGGPIVHDTAVVAAAAPSSRLYQQRLGAEHAIGAQPQPADPTAVAPQQLSIGTAAPAALGLYSDRGGLAPAYDADRHTNGGQAGAVHPHNTSKCNQQYASEPSSGRHRQPSGSPAGATAAAQPLQAGRASKRTAVKSYRESESEEEDRGGRYGTEYEGSDDDDVSGDDDDDGGDDDDDDDDDEWEAADYQYAQQLQEEWNGLRSRSTRPQRGSAGSLSPVASAPSASVKRGGSWGEAEGGRKRGRPAAQRTSSRAVAKVSYAESGDSEGDDANHGSQARREPVPALDDVGGDDKPGRQPWDEVERVLNHRGADDASDAAAGNRWDRAEFHIKWKGYSYTHCSWERMSTLRHLGGFKRVTNYCRRFELSEVGRLSLSREELELQDVQRQMEEQLIEQYTQVERIVSERSGAVRCLLVKWEGLPYCECTWESEADVMAARGGPQARDDFLTRQQRLQEPSKGVDAARSSYITTRRSIAEMATQPDFLAGGNLRDYQLEGVNWLTYAWIKGRNCILADEMGLGKTVQCVSFLGLLAETCGVRGPFLVVVPLSTVPNWIKEFRKWVPMLNALVYVGNGRSREVIRAFEFGGSFSLPDASSCSNSNRSRPYNFEVLISTYELVLKDAALLSKVNWAYLMVDEAHRLKNSESALYQELAGWQFKNKLLVTGTPLQNSLKELWALLHFLEPGHFNSCEEFEARYSLQESEQVSQLHAVLKPHLLRRVIKEVEKSLPPKNERMLRVEMTPLQRQYYKWILARNFKELNKGAHGGGHVSLLNIISELKKACNHPFLFESAEDEYRGSEGDKSVVDRLILTSGKMVLLDKLLRRLRDTGHRVLLFSQMVRVLDIISDYLRLRGWPHQRLDGSTPAGQRHAAMEAFNKPDSPDFAFLLSTRAGGLGINLATADTVIIFDSDWNPQNDLQAMSRAHRIGQTETVNIYRFVTSGSVEEEILERAKRKMVLDHLVIQRMDTSGRTVLDPAAAGGNKNAKAMFGKDELAAILRFGAEDLFKAAEEGSAERSKQLLEEDIDVILERAEVVEQNGLSGRTAADGAAADLLSSFNVATFKNDEDDATFWSRLIREEERPPDEAVQPLGLRAARVKGLGTEHVSVITTKSGPRSRTMSPEGSDGEGDEGAHKAAGAKTKKGSSRRRKGASNEPGPPVQGAVLRVDEWPWEVDQAGRPAHKQDVAARLSPGTTPCTLSRRDATAFVRAVRRYGLKCRIPVIAAEVGGAVKEAGLPQQLSLWRALVDGCKQALEVAQQTGQQQEGKDVSLDFFGCPVKAGELIHHLDSMSVLAKRIDSLTAADQDPATHFRLEAAAVPPAAKWGKAVGWTPRDDAALLLGVYYHGLGHWEVIIHDQRLALQGKLQCVLAGRDEPVPASGDKSILPKGSHLETRVLGVLRKMHSCSSKAAAGPASKSHHLQHVGVHLPPKKAAAARAAAGMTSQRKLTPPPAVTAAAGQPVNSAQSPLRPAAAADRNASAAVGPTSVAGSYGPFTADQLQEQLLSVTDALTELAKLGDKELEPRQVMALTKKHLLAIGHAVERAAAANSDMRKPLWRYTINYIKSPMSEDEIVRVYNRLHRQAMLAAGAPTPAVAGVKAPAVVAPARVAQLPRLEHKQPVAAVAGSNSRSLTPAAAVSPSPAAAMEVVLPGSDKNPTEHRQHHQPGLHAGPRRALQLHKQPEQQPQQQQQQQPQQQHDRGHHHRDRDRQRSSSADGDRARGRSRSLDRQSHRHPHHHHRSRSHSRDRHESRQHRGRSRSRDRHRGCHGGSSSRSRSRDRHRQRGFYSSRHSRRSSSHSRSRSQCRDGARGRRRRRSRSWDRQNRRGSRSRSREPPGQQPAVGRIQRQAPQQLPLPAALALHNGISVVPPSALAAAAVDGASPPLPPEPPSVVPPPPPPPALGYC